MSDVLDLPMDPNRNDASATSVREYLKKLLLEVWNEGESFSGKRPFGNSGWEYDLYRPLIVAKVVRGQIDEEEGDIIDVDTAKAHRVIAAAIKTLI